MCYRKSMIKTENREEILKRLTKCLKPGEDLGEYTPEPVDFRQLKITYICLGQGLEEKCLWKDLTANGFCRHQVDRIDFVECIRGVL